MGFVPFRGLFWRLTDAEGSPEVPEPEQPEPHQLRPLREMSLIFALSLAASSLLATPRRAHGAAARPPRSAACRAPLANLRATTDASTDGEPPPSSGTCAGGVCGLPTRVIEREEGVPTTRVLIIYTGGTLGMTHREGSLSPEPEQGNLAALIRNMPEFGDTSLPAVDMLEYDPLLDSSNVGPAEWAMLAESVGAHYYDYDGFVIIHGTDTMCGRRTRAPRRAIRGPTAAHTHFLSAGATRRRRCRSCSRASASPSSSPAA